MRRNAEVAVSYSVVPTRPAYVNATAEVIEDPAERQRIWDLFVGLPPPIGFDVRPIFKAADNPAFGLIRLTPWRILLAEIGPAGGTVWRR